MSLRVFGLFGIVLLLAGPALAGDELTRGGHNIMTACDGTWRAVGAGWVLPNSTAKVYEIDLYVGVEGGTQADLQWSVYDSDNKVLFAGLLDRYAEPSAMLEHRLRLAPNWIRANGAIAFMVRCGAFTEANWPRQASFNVQFYYSYPCVPYVVAGCTP